MIHDNIMLLYIPSMCHHQEWYIHHSTLKSVDRLRFMHIQLLDLLCTCRCLYDIFCVFAQSVVIISYKYLSYVQELIIVGGTIINT